MSTTVLNTEKFPINLRRIRTAKNISVKDIETSCGIHANNIYAYENTVYVRLPNAATLVKLANFMEVSIDEFFVDD